MKRDLSERLESAVVKSAPIKRVARSLDRWLNRNFQKTALRPLKLFFNGTWLGHPLHSVLTDLPIGAWTVTILLDAIALIFRSPVGPAASLAAGLGVVAALPTIVTGLMDWMDVNPPEKAVGALHAGLNATATLLFTASLAIRWSQNWQTTAGAFVVALAGYLLLMGGSFLGGAMVYHLGVMVNRNAYRAGPEDFSRALAVDQLREGQLRRVDVEGQPILLVRSGERIFAVGAVCSHYGAPLEEGKLSKDTIQCPWHGSRFALVDGRVREGPACAALPAYEVRIAGDQVQVKFRP